MKTILDEIAEKTRERIVKKKKEVSVEQLKERIYRQPRKKEPFLFQKVLGQKELSFICEVKKASPSKGVIAENFPYLKIAEEYEKAGASAISCLTEPFYFQGQDSYLEEIAAKVRIPVLRKDFTVDPYMIYEARAMNADAVLLICALLQEEELQEYLELTEQLGMSALVESHSEQEMEMAIRCGADILGVNNRDLHNFHVDLNTSIRLGRLVPEGKIFISESGIRTPEDIKVLREYGADGVLVGETLMRGSDKKNALDQLRGTA